MRGLIAVIPVSSRTLISLNPFAYQGIALKSCRLLAFLNFVELVACILLADFREFLANTLTSRQEIEQVSCDYSYIHMDMMQVLIYRTWYAQISGFGRIPAR